MVSTGPCLWHGPTGVSHTAAPMAYAAVSQLFAEYSGHSWEYEDRIYRFYHGSFKVYWLQNGTTKITQALQALAPLGGRPFLARQLIQLH